jgi:type I restriction enzyme S subunit
MTYPLVKLSSIISLSTSRLADPAAAGIERFVGLEHISPENLHIRNWGLVANGITFTSHFKPGQVLFGKRRAYQRKVAISEFEGVCSSDIYIFEIKNPDVLLPELLPFICQSEGFYQYALKTSAGSLSPRTNWSHLANYEFPLPPLDEQRRIADLLWAADDVITNWIDAYEKAIKAFKVYAISTFQNAIEEFGTVAIGSIAIIRGGKRLPKGTTFSEIPTKHPYIRVVDFLDLSVKENDLKYISEEVHKQIRNYIITDEDVYVSIAGTTGIVGMIPSHLSGANLTENAARLVFKNKKSFYKKFVLHYLASPLGQQSLQKQTMTTTQPKLAITRLAQINLPKPNYDMQIQIAKSLDEFHHSLDLLNEHIVHSKKLKAALLHHHLG